MAQWFQEFGARPARVLDLGCGDCASVEGALRAYPNVAYVGVEQDKNALARARAALADRPDTLLLSGPGEGFAGDGHDLVMSLSVLEHVKRLDAFLRASVEAARPGGMVRHRYDLGHALTPSSPGERLRVAVARRAPRLVRTQRFTTYPDLDRIRQTLVGLGLEDVTVSQGQAPSLKQAVNRIDQSSEAARALVADLLEIDRRLWVQLGEQLPRTDRDRLFPSVLVSGRRPH